jgi:hypothetical protein
MATRCAHVVKWSGCELHRRASFRADGCNTLYDHEVAVEGRAKTIKGTGGAGKEIVLGLLYRETRKVRVARLASREKGTLHEHVSDNVASGADYHSAPALFKHRGGESIEKRQSVLERYQGRLPPRRPRRREHLRSTLPRITVAVHDNAERPRLEIAGGKRHAARHVHYVP